jgi:hypothetical protein
VSYACDARTVDEEFRLSKKEYEYITGRSQSKKKNTFIVTSFTIQPRSIALKNSKISGVRPLQFGTYRI